jgi:hypothetical protein
MKAVIPILALIIISIFIFVDSKKPRTIATTATSSFTVSGKIPVVLKVNTIKQTPLSYQINEISNNPEGYTLSLKTDAKIVYFDNQKLTIQNGEVILNHVESQTESVNSFKILKFDQAPSEVQLSITAP